MGDKQNKRFQLSFIAVFKIDFHGPLRCHCRRESAATHRLGGHWREFKPSSSK
jgi:hypothetical protein